MMDLDKKDGLLSDVNNVFKGKIFVLLWNFNTSDALINVCVFDLGDWDSICLIIISPQSHLRRMIQL
jgi:hypothetical protein